MCMCHVFPTKEPSAGSWPVATFGSMIYPHTTMQLCDEARALAEFIYWTQSSPDAKRIADRYPSSLIFYF
jgi:hypothetical protein